MSDRMTMIVFDPATDEGGRNAVRILCPEAFAQALIDLPGVDIVQDDESALVLACGHNAGVVVDLHL